jgi:hypothetical protein
VTSQPRQLEQLVLYGMVTLLSTTAWTLPVAYAQANGKPNAEQAPRPKAEQAPAPTADRASESQAPRVVRSDRSAARKKTASATTGYAGVPASQRGRARTSPQGELEERDVPAPEVKPTALSERLETVKVPAVHKKPSVPPGPETEGPVAVAPPRPVERPWPTLNREDLSLRERVLQALAQDKQLTYSARGVSVDARDGEIVLSGALNTQFEKARVAQIASRVTGARVVRDDVTVRTEAASAARRQTRP